MLFSGLFVHALAFQTLVQRITDVYNILDSAAYIEDMIISFKEDKLNYL